MTQEVECQATVAIFRVNAKKSSLELLEIVVKKLLLETSLDVLLIILNRSLFLLDEEIFGGGLSGGVLLDELGDFGGVLGCYAFERLLEDFSLILILGVDDIHFFCEVEVYVADVLACLHEVSK